MSGLPGSVLFACTMNSIRSPMAEAYLKQLHGTRIYVDSVGVRAREVDGFAIAAMDEVGIDIRGHKSKSFDQLEDTLFDVIITLSPEAHHHALELTRTMAAEVKFWNTLDPSIIEGRREERLDAFRTVRDGLITSIQTLFPPQLKPT